MRQARREIETMDQTLVALTLFAALATWVLAGTYFTFSIVVIQALDRLPASQAVAAMQSINRLILNPFFGLVFGGSAAASVVLAAWSLLRWDGAESASRLAGSLLVLVGSLLVTVTRNVPLNTALGGVEPGTTTADQLWARIVSEWLPWNHVRTIASLAATTLLILALR